MSIVNGAVFTLFAAIAVLGVWYALESAAAYAREQQAAEDDERRAAQTARVTEFERFPGSSKVTPDRPYGDAFHTSDDPRERCSLCRAGHFPHVVYTGFGWTGEERRR